VKAFRCQLPTADCFTPIDRRCSEHNPINHRKRINRAASLNIGNCVACPRNLPYNATVFCWMAIFAHRFFIFGVYYNFFRRSL
jgi:hypothetical protein